VHQRHDARAFDEALGVRDATLDSPARERRDRASDRPRAALDGRIDVGGPAR
jgi:hypothetical protein